MGATNRQISWVPWAAGLIETASSKFSEWPHLNVTFEGDTCFDLWPYVPERFHNHTTNCGTTHTHTHNVQQLFLSE